MVDREGAVTQSNSMLSVRALTSQLQSQMLIESQGSISTSSHDENAASKIRHHSEPHPPASLLKDPSKKMKIITFKEALDDNNRVALTSILINPDSSDTSTWDAGSLNPPNKRQCRSMSIPNDGDLQTRWLQTQTRGHLHRPTALRPNGSSSHRSKHQQYSQNRGLQASRGLPPVWSSLAPSDTSTPPESPRSRPSSASSGYFDSPLASSSNLTKHRCESLQMLPTSEHSTNASDSGHESTPMRVNAAKSMPSVADPSRHISPSKQLLLRCQSQPCVIHERRCGIKRRRDEQRPSINFNKMTETALCKKPDASAVAGNRLSSPLRIKPVARYGQIFPERVLQTIASSPQDINYISAVESNTWDSSTRMTPPAIASPIQTTEVPGVNDSDSGCSTTDDELCDITNKMSAVVDSLPTHNGFCTPLSPNHSTNPSVCSCSDDAELGGMFAMESAPNTELDLDMIENN
ncbi:protein FAM53A-like [Watersipora subatra]|uniref:protein FAM53A-like n=1 Tax=Watersipora subatra TaxID=2589382 RepID=UPI00355BA1BE